MIEEIKVVEPEVKVPEVVAEPEVKEPSEMEQRAMSMGWRPKDEWRGDEVDFIEAGEFVRRKPLFDKIDSTNKRLRDVEQSLNQLAHHHAQVKETEFQRALKELRLDKRAALKEGDTEAALELEDRMDELSEQRKEEVVEEQKQIQQQKQQGPTSGFLSWVKYNDWYLKDEDMHDFADGAAASFVQRSSAKGVNLTEDEVFSHVLDKVKRAYPEKFENPNRNRATTVSTGDRGGKPIKSSTYKLSDEEEAVARNFEKMGVMTKAEYIKERAALRGEE